MKIKNSKINQKLLELYLIKARTYEQYDKKIKEVVNISLAQTLLNFKKTLRIIFKFNIKNKKILFLGLNGLILKKINKETNHIAIPPKVKLQGIIFNKLKSKEKDSLLKHKTPPNLIVIFKEIESYGSILSESFKYKIPTIIFGEKKNNNNNRFLYNIPANTDFLLNNKKIFYNCLKFLFKKTIKLNHKKMKKNEKKRYKPFYKNFLKLRENIQNRPKVFKFKRKKWGQFQFFARKKLKFFRRYKVKDQFKLVVSKFRYHSKKNSFKKRFKNIMVERKLFSFFYGILKKKYLKTHLKNSFYKKNKNTTNYNTYKHNALKFFESRLDTVLYRSKFCFSMKNADQLILHGHILVNGIVIRTKSYILKNNDLIEISPTIKSRILVKKNLDRSNFWPIPQKYLIVNYSTLQILFILNENNILPLFDHYLNVNSLFLNIKK